MIAPNRQMEREPRQATQWSLARRAVAAAFLRSSPADTPGAPLSARAGWWFVAWAVAVAAVYFIYEARSLTSGW